MCGLAGDPLRLHWNSRQHGVLVLRSSHLAPWSVLFGYRFRAPDHINVLELTALNVTGELANMGVRNQRMLRGQSRRPGGLFQKYVLRQGVSTSDSGGLHSSVSTHHFQSIYCGCRLGEILPMRRLEAPLLTAGNARSRCGQAKLPLFSSGQQRLRVS